MSEQKWWAKAILVGAVVGLVCLAVGALGTKLGIWSFTAGLGLFALGGALGALALVLGLIDCGGRCHSRSYRRRVWLTVPCRTGRAADS